MPPNSESGPSGFLVWHPDVHEHFHERLHFFLLALKPYRELAFRERLHDLLREFGVSDERGRQGYCSYEVLGDLDHILRIWLPVQSEMKFITRARTLLPNLTAILQFSVHRIVSDWRFEKKRPEERFLRHLKPDRLRIWQSATNRETCAEAIEANAAFWIDEPNGIWLGSDRPQPKRGRRGTIKAFISLRPPANADDAQRDYIENELVTLIRGSSGISDCSFYSGVGFTWLLANVVAENFADLANLVSNVGREYGGLGVSTSTYAVTRPLAEGDSIGLLSFEGEEKLPVEIEEFLPALTLRKPSEREEIVRFIKDRVLSQRLSDDEKKPMREFLHAVLELDESRATAALHWPTVQTERMIRDQLKPVLLRCYEGDIAKIAEYFRAKGHDFKTFDTIALGAVLTGTRDHILKIWPEWPKSKEFPEKDLQELATTRNKLMHGAVLKLGQEWRNLAGHLLSLFRVREEFLAALSECLQKLPQRLQ